MLGDTRAMFQYSLFKEEKRKLCSLAVYVRFAYFVQMFNHDNITLWIAIEIFIERPYSSK